MRGRLPATPPNAHDRPHAGAATHCNRARGGWPGRITRTLSAVALSSCKGMPLRPRPERR
ncbi:protein of unknown function [Modestobacter italicus]|uniref:Uncharacterized protein n=1 Tax=Modestobacter italicus (strain DSM 44449 / CECT 9708 / BC 501) TaxID=2732864 RepID=I4EX77_MODI5|nr:protein of unknown function [Modestobacter marinus]